MAAVPTRFGAIGVQRLSTGFRDYRESSIGLTAAKKLGEKVSLGIRINYHTLSIPAYGKAAAITADAGLLLHLSAQLHFGLALLNPSGSRRENPLYLPGLYHAGFGYDQSDKLHLSVSFLKEQSQEGTVQVGVRYLPAPEIPIRIVIQSADPSLSFSAGFMKQRLRLDIYNSWHLRLGISSGLMLYYFPSISKERQ